MGVKKVIGNVNVKFNATRALLLIGQGQFMVLQSATTFNPNYEKIMNFLHKLPGLQNLAWSFNINQARLLHASLLCFECLVIAIFNLKLWQPESASELADDAAKLLSDPLLEDVE